MVVLAAWAAVMVTVPATAASNVASGVPRLTTVRPLTVDVFFSVASLLKAGGSVDASPMINEIRLNSEWLVFSSLV